MEENDLMNKECACTDISGLSNFKLVDVDGFVSSVYCPVTDNKYIP